MKTYVLLCFLSITIFVYSSNDREIINQIDTINSSALSLYNNNQIVEAFNEFNNAKALSDSIQDYYGSAVASCSLGNIYSLMENYKSAEKNYLQALKLLNKLDDNYLLASTYLNLAKIFNKNSDYVSAIPYFKKAIKYSLNIHNLNDLEKKQVKGVYFEARLSLCELYIQNNDLDEALMNLLKIKNDINTARIDTSTEGYFEYIYGTYYARKELYNNANSKFRKAILLLEDKKASKDLDFELLSKVYMQLSISLAKSDQSTEAYLTLLEQNAYKEQRLNKIKQRQDLITKSKFLIEDYKNNAELANTEKLQQIEIANKLQKINVIIFITLLLLLVSVIVILRGYNLKRKLSKRLKLKNTELQIAKDEALKSSELKSKFISNVTHELRTPLFGVVGITSLLLDNNDLNKNDRKYLKSLKHSGDYLLNLINDILQVGKMEANKLELKNTPVNLRELLQDIVSSFDYRIQESNNKMTLSIDNAIPEYIKCDEIRLSQILINLLGNSIKFTTNGLINLKASLVSIDGENVSVKFKVKDNGIGIPKEKFDTIFDNFSQLEESNLNYQGTGLGLSITKNLIELFESKIELESSVGVGTKISFEIGFEVDKKETKVISDFNTLNNNIGVSNEKYKILVAEDNKINQIVTKNLLKKQGFSCTMVDNGKAALEEIRGNNHYDLVLMDINMPVMNGKEATKLIREFNTRLPIIALTASDINEVEQNCKHIGFNDLIIKPFDNYEFFHVITQNIQNSKKDNVLAKVS